MRRSKTTLLLIATLCLAGLTSSSPTLLRKHDLALETKIDRNIATAIISRRNSSYFEIPKSRPSNITTGIIISREAAELKRRLAPGLTAFAGVALRAGSAALLRAAPTILSNGARFAGRFGAGALTAARSGGSTMMGGLARGGSTAIGSLSRGATTAFQAGRVGLGTAGRAGVGAVTRAGGAVGRGVGTGGRSVGTALKPVGTGAWNGAKAAGNKGLDGFELMWKNKMNTISTGMLGQQIVANPL